MKNFKELVFEALGQKIQKYNFVFSEIDFDSLLMQNNKLRILLSYHNGDFGMSMSILNSNLNFDLMDLILKRYPEYLETDSKIVIYNLKIEDFENSSNYIIYLIKVSFDFLENEYPNVL